MKDIFHKEIISPIEQSVLSNGVFDRTSSNAYYSFTNDSSHVNLITESCRIV